MEKEVIRNRIQTVMSILDERQKRIYLAAEAEALGRGGMGYVSDIANVNKNTLTAGKNDLEELRSSTKSTGDFSPDSEQKKKSRRIRKRGGGRKSITETQPGIVEALLKLVDGDTYGNPQNPLSWTTKSIRKLSDELREEGYVISYVKVKQLLEQEGYSLQSNSKMKQVGKAHEDRDAQFQHINKTAAEYIASGEPVVSVDCKKKENLGEFANKGAEYRKKGDPVKVLDHDFFDRENGKAIPYGTYDIANNEGYVNVGICHDTASFAVNSIYAWWREMGHERYPRASMLYITADGGGSNGSRNRLWKTELQNFADKTGLMVEVSHFPPGTSKWNKIEHRLFSFISKNWRGRPLESLEIVVNLIASTTTKTGLKVHCGVDKTIYETGIKVTDEELKNVRLVPDDFHGEWNYIILPDPYKKSQVVF